MSSPRLLLAFDFGMKRIGIAIGQTLTGQARPLATLNAKQGTPAWDMLDKLIKQWKPDALVVGIPLNMDGTDQPMTLHARAFGQTLKLRYHLPIHEMDERLTTKEARDQLFHEGGYKALQSGRVDQVAAVLILENWFSLQEGRHT